MESERWTTPEIVQLALDAISNADDSDSFGQGFRAEWEFQMAAPEHAGRPTPTPIQMAAARAIWQAEEESRDGK